MHRPAARRPLAAALCLAAACRATAPAAGTADAAGGAARDAQARAAIAAAARELSARYLRGDAAGIAALYTDDGMLLPPSGPTVRGRDALVRAWTLPPGHRMLEHRTTSDSVVVSGPVAYDWGTYHLRGVSGNGAERVAGGKYVIVWREAAPGRWLMHVDIWNTAPR